MNKHMQDMIDRNPGNQDVLECIKEIEWLQARNQQFLEACKEFLRVNLIRGYEFDSNEPRCYSAIEAAVAVTKGRHG